MGLAGFTAIDIVAMLFYAACWIGYHLGVERNIGRKSLNRLMHSHRYAWMRESAGRDNRILDGNLNASLQNGTAFFASTSLLAIGASLALLRSTQEVLTLFADLPFGFVTTKLVWELKTLGLTIIFVYAFFKFSWSYRLFNYSAILIGAMPGRSADPREIEVAAWRAASMNTVAGRHFNRGQRAFFFAVAYLGWFVNAYVMIASTAAVLFVMWRRQFASDALAALGEGPWPERPR